MSDTVAHVLLNGSVRDWHHLVATTSPELLRMALDQAPLPAAIRRFAERLIP